MVSMEEYTENICPLLKQAKKDLQELIQNLDKIMVRCLFLHSQFLTSHPQNHVLDLEKNPAEHMLFYGKLPCLIEDSKQMEVWKFFTIYIH